MLAVAAEIAVPLPLSKPVIVVVSVIAGVVVAVVTVPAKPLADTTDTLVTVPCGLAAVVMLVTRPYVSIVTTGIKVDEPVVPAVATPLARSITGVVPPVEVIRPVVPVTDVT